ncbi:MAG: hypothetical protein JHC82_07105 [Stenotrophomonas sp.]|nr:hypothetical protein [Stenotrophomonas sp.]
MPLPVRCTSPTPAPVASAALPHTGVAHASRALPLDVGNAPLAAAVSAARDTASPEDGHTAALAAQASALCRDQGLPAAITWMKQQDAAWSNAVRARVLQSLTLALPLDSTWRALDRAAVRNADAVRAGLDCHRHALRALAHAMEAFDAPVLEGRTGFLARSRMVREVLGELGPAALPGPLRRVAADAGPGLDALVRRTRSDDLRMWLAVCIGWQRALPAAATTADPDDLPRLWFDYALDCDAPQGGDVRRQFWRLATIGRNLLMEASHYLIDPERYEGAVIASLRRGDDADAVCARFHMDREPVLERWVHQVAGRLQQGQPLQRDDALPRW